MLLGIPTRSRIQLRCNKCFPTPVSGRRWATQ
jgi:hypothetical protein